MDDLCHRVRTVLGSNRPIQTTCPRRCDHSPASSIAIYPASTTVDARRNNAGFGARRRHRYFLSSRIHVSQSVLNQCWWPSELIEFRSLQGGQVIKTLCRFPLFPTILVVRRTACFQPQG